MIVCWLPTVSFCRGPVTVISKDSNQQHWSCCTRVEVKQWLILEIESRGWAVELVSSTVSWPDVAIKFIQIESSPVEEWEVVLCVLCVFTSVSQRCVMTPCVSVFTLPWFIVVSCDFLDAVSPWLAQKPLTTPSSWHWKDGLLFFSPPPFRQTKFVL